MPKPFAILSHLVQHAGHLVTHDELLKAVWPDTHVQADVLRKHVKEIRRVLGDNAESPHLIETVPKRGYRFVAVVSEDAVASKVLPATLVGRSAEHAVLNARLARALAGERQMIFIAGEAGMGKSSLVNAFQRGIDGAEPVALAWGQSMEGYGGKEPYYPVLEALGRLGRGPEASVVTSALSQCAPTWLNQLPSLVPTDRRAALQREAARATQPRMVRELCEVLEKIAQSTALVLIIEDLHWVDHSTLDALAAIARRREPARLVVLCTYRPAGVILAESPFKDLRRDLLMHRLAHEITLQPLGARDIGDYIEASLSPHSLQGLDALIHRHSGGNPLFMAATLDHLVERGVVAWDGTCWRMTVPIQELEPGVPDTLRHVLELQIEGLREDERRVLMCASVVGERFSSWSVEIMLGAGAATGEAACESVAARGHVLRAVGPAESPEGRRATFEFTHALYRDALYRRLTSTQRTEYHRRLAEALDVVRASGRPELAGETAAHFEAARIYDRAFENITLAAETALQRCAHHEAVALLGHARDLASKIGDGAAVDRDVRLLQRIGDAHYAHGDMGAAADAYDAAAATATAAHRASDAAEALLRVARAAVFFDVERALTSCERAERIAASAGRADLQARATLVGTCWDLLHRGWSRERAAVAAAAFARATGNVAFTPAERILWANVRVFRSEYTEAIDASDAALGELPRTASLWEQLAAIAAKCGAMLFCGQYRAAHEALNDAIALATRNDNHAWVDILSGELAAIHLYVFDFAGAREITSARLHLSGGVASGDMQLRVVLGAAELGLGRMRQAARWFSDVIARPRDERPVVHWYSRLHARLGMAEVALASGELTTAHDRVLGLARDIAALDESMLKASVWELSARIALARAAYDEADAAVEEAERSLATFELPHAAWRVQATAAAVRGVTDPVRADNHRLRARAILLAIARSIAGCDALDRALHAAPAFRALTNDDLQVSR